MLNLDDIISRHFKKTAKSVTRGITVFFLRWLLRESDLKDLLSRYGSLSPSARSDAVLRHFNVNIEWKHLEIENIPHQGRCFIIANHPIGALDALGVIYLVTRVRSDIKILGSNLLSEIQGIKDLIIPIDYDANEISDESIAKIKEHGKNGVLIHFPALEVSRRSIWESHWRSEFITIINQLQAPILPVYINAKHSWRWWLGSYLGKHISKLLLSREMWWMQGKTISFTVGRLIPFHRIQTERISKRAIAKKLRKHLFRIGGGKEGYYQGEAGIAFAEKKSDLKSELATHKKLHSIDDDLSLYCTKLPSDSSVMREIGRLREISFRVSGSGSGLAFDIDPFDKYYYHLILWNEKDLEIMGAYRIGNGKEILAEYGATGLYSSTLFSFNEPFITILPRCIEFGRSFVQPRYWNSRALEHLWYGIGTFTRQFDNMDYFFGPVSLSDNFSDAATALIVHFYRTQFKIKNETDVQAYHYNPFVVNDALLKPFLSIFEDQDPKVKLADFRISLKMMSARVPILFKQYSDLAEEGGVAFLGFGIDPQFSNCIDGLVLIRRQLIKSKNLRRFNIRGD